MLPFLIAYRSVGCQTYDGPDLIKAIHFSCLGPGLLVCCFVHRNSTGVFILLQIFSDVV